MNTVTVKHNFETAHRLYDLGPDQKCWNVHGHSWLVEVDVSAPNLDSRGMVVEFGALKRAFREEIDRDFDHGIMLNIADSLCSVLKNERCKVAIFEDDPTVENVALTMAAITRRLLIDVPHAPGAHVSAARVQETAVNGASWCQPHYEVGG